MKKIFIILLLILLSTYADDYKKELANLFSQDVKQAKLDTYEEYINSRDKTTKLEYKILTKIKGRSTKNIVILVTSEIYNQVKNRIDRYIADIGNYCDGEVSLIEINKTAPHNEIRTLLQQQDNIIGAILIGDIEVAWYEINNDYGQYGHSQFPCDFYYMDLDGAWVDNNSNGKYDSHTGDVAPEIFIGRISAAHMGTLESEISGLKSYLDKNHDFYTGATTINREYGLAYTDKDWAPYSDFKTSIAYLYGQSKTESYDYNTHNSFYGKTDYLERLGNNKYEFIQFSCHSTWSAHYPGSYSATNIISTTDVFSTPPAAIGYNLFCCSGCRWTAAGPTSQGYLGGAYVYNEYPKALVAVGSTKTGSMLDFAKFYKPLGENKTIGESLLIWFQNALGDSHSTEEKSWHYGMTIVGDPMIRFLNTPSGITDDLEIMQKNIDLVSNYPNPFNNETSIVFQLQKPTQLSLKLYDIRGQFIKNIEQGKVFSTGKNAIKLRMDKLHSGVYFYKIIGKEINISKKILYVR